MTSMKKIYNVSGTFHACSTERLLLSLITITIKIIIYKLDFDDIISHTVTYTPSHSGLREREGKKYHPANHMMDVLFPIISISPSSHFFLTPFAFLSPSMSNLKYTFALLLSAARLLTCFCVLFLLAGFFCFTFRACFLLPVR